MSCCHGFRYRFADMICRPLRNSIRACLLNADGTELSECIAVRAIALTQAGEVIVRAVVVLDNVAAEARASTRWH